MDFGKASTGIAKKRVYMDLTTDRGLLESFGHKLKNSANPKRLGSPAVPLLPFSFWAPLLKPHSVGKRVALSLRGHWGT